MKRRQDREIKGLDRDVYMELKHWCFQYNSWKKELKELNDSLKPSGINNDGMPHAQNTSSLTEKTAIRLVMLQKKIDMLDKAANITNKEFAKYMILYCTNRDMSFDTLQRKYHIPCSKATFFRLRTQFFKNLYELKENG